MVIAKRRPGVVKQVLAVKEGDGAFDWRFVHNSAVGHKNNPFGPFRDVRRGEIAMHCKQRQRRSQAFLPRLTGGSIIGIAP